MPKPDQDADILVFGRPKREARPRPRHMNDNLQVAERVAKRTGTSVDYSPYGPKIALGGRTVQFTWDQLMKWDPRDYATILNLLMGQPDADDADDADDA